MTCHVPFFRGVLTAAVLSTIASPTMLLAKQVPGEDASYKVLSIASSSNVKRLLESARMWEAKNRTDLVRNALQKVLLINPEQVDALSLLGLVEVRSHQLPEARKILDKLLKINPEHSATLALAEAYRIETTDRREIEQVRLLARSGKLEDAASRLKDLFPKGAPLSGELAMDYYRILASTPKWRGFAIAELSRVIKSQPDNLRLELLLATLLIERQDTLQNGLKMIRRLATRPDADRKSALELWQRALARVDDPEYLPWFERYIQEVPADNEVGEKIARLRSKLVLQQVSAREKIATGSENGQSLNEAIVEAGSANVSGESGLIKLREGRHEEAMALFEQALLSDPKNSSKWGSLRETAKFWGGVDKVRALLSQGRANEAAVNAYQLLDLQPGNRVLRSLLADALLAQGKNMAAEIILRGLVNDSAPDIDALDNLVKLLRKDGRIAEAQQVFFDTEARINKVPIDKVRHRRMIEVHAGLLAGKADELVAKGKDSQAISALEDAIRLRPDDAWIRYSLAKLYRRIGVKEFGRSVMNDGVKVSPLPDMRYATALFFNAEDDFYAALAMIEQIPEADRSESMRGFQRNLIVQNLVRSSRFHFKNEHRAAAEADLLKAVTNVVDDPDMLVIIAREWIAQGQTDTGLDLVAGWLGTQHQDAAISVRLHYGELLASAGRDDALALWLDHLDTLAGLSANQLSDVEDQRFRLTLRQVHCMVDAGKFENAEAHLMTVAPEKRIDKRWLKSLVDLRTAHKDYAGATEVIKQVLAGVQEDDADTRLDMAWRLIAAKQEQEAKAISDALSVKFPYRDDVIVRQGKLAEAMGDYNKAATFYQQAMVIESNNKLASDNNDMPGEHAFRELSTRRQGQVATAYMPSTKPGENGISRLDSTEIPLYARIPIGYEGHAFFHADAVELDAGSLYASDLEKIVDHGKVMAATKGAISLRTDYTARLAQEAQGVALATGYETDNWRFDLGTTPLGFPVQDITGGIRYRNYDATSSFSLNVSRRPVTSSLVSYAGAKDLVTGEVWGGARRNGLNLHYGHDIAVGSVFADVGAGLISGKNLQANRELTFRTGVELPLLDVTNNKVTTSAIINYWQYNQNQNYYTFGQGGYYSPQSYLSFSLPLDWMGRSGLLSYRFRGSVGYSKSSEDSAAYYPTRSQLQADSGNPVYSGGSGKGVSYNLKAALEYRATSHWVAGADFEMDRSTYYAPDRAIFYLRYLFEPQTGVVPISTDPVRTYRSY